AVPRLFQVQQVVNQVFDLFVRQAQRRHGSRRQRLRVGNREVRQRAGGAIGPFPEPLRSRLADLVGRRGPAQGVAAVGRQDGELVRPPVVGPVARRSL